MVRRVSTDFSERPLLPHGLSSHWTEMVTLCVFLMVLLGHCRPCVAGSFTVTVAFGWEAECFYSSCSWRLKLSRPLAVLPVFVPVGADKGDRAVWIGSTTLSNRSSQWRQAEHLCRRLQWRPSGLITGAGSPSSLTRRHARQDLIQTDSFPVSMVFIRER